MCGPYKQESSHKSNQQGEELLEGVSGEDKSSILFRKDAFPYTIYNVYTKLA